jgi:hypothetical protein
MRVLTEAAQNDRDAFERYTNLTGCSCHISPPCGYCTHPGNPMNQEEDESCWKVSYTKDEALWYSICQMRRAARVLDLEAIRVGGLIVTNPEFKKIYDAVTGRLKDLVNWRQEDVVRTTVEETLAFLGGREKEGRKEYLVGIYGTGLDMCADECEKAMDPEELKRLRTATSATLTTC